MTSELRKFHLIELLVLIKDEAILTKVEELLKQERIKSYESSMKPMSVNELQARAMASEKDIHDGRGIALEDLEKDMENW